MMSIVACIVGICSHSLEELKKSLLEQRKAISTIVIQYEANTTSLERSRTSGLQHKISVTAHGTFTFHRTKGYFRNEYSYSEQLGDATSPTSGSRVVTFDGKQNSELRLIDGQFSAATENVSVSKYSGHVSLSILLPLLQKENMSLWLTKVDPNNVVITKFDNQLLIKGPALQEKGKIVQIYDESLGLAHVSTTMELDAVSIAEKGATIQSKWSDFRLIQGLAWLPLKAEHDVRSDRVAQYYQSSDKLQIRQYTLNQDLPDSFFKMQFPDGTRVLNRNNGSESIYRSLTNEKLKQQIEKAKELEKQAAELQLLDTTSEESFSLLSFISIVAAGVFFLTIIGILVYVKQQRK